MCNLFKSIANLVVELFSNRKPSASQPIKHNKFLQGNSFNNNVIETKDNKGGVNSNMGDGTQLFLRTDNDIVFNINICGNELLEGVQSSSKGKLFTHSPGNIAALIRAAKSLYFSDTNHRDETKQLLVQLLCSKFESRDEESDDYTDAIQKTCEISFKDIQRIVLIVFCMCVVSKVDKGYLNKQKVAIDRLFNEVGSITNQIVLRLEEKNLLIPIVDKQFDVSSLLYLRDELGDTYTNVMQCIRASELLVRYRPTTVAFVLTKAYLSTFWDLNIDNVCLGDIQLRHMDLTVDNLVSNGEVAVIAGEIDSLSNQNNNVSSPSGR